MEIPLTRFFRVDSQSQILNRFKDDLAAVESGTIPSYDALGDFSVPSILGELAYICGEYGTALSLFRKACEGGRPLISEPANSSPWLRVTQVRFLINLAKGAYLCGLAELSHDAFLRAYELVPQEIELVKSQGEADIYRHYAAVALGQKITSLPTRIHDPEWYTWMLPLSRAIAAHIQFRMGQIDKARATEQLRQLIVRTNGDWHERVGAIAHALYLQTAFPDVFDPVLPPLAVSTSD